MFRNLLRPDSGLMITMTQLTDTIFLSLFWILGLHPPGHHRHVLRRPV